MDNPSVSPDADDCWCSRTDDRPQQVSTAATAERDPPAAASAAKVLPATSSETPKVFLAPAT